MAISHIIRDRQSIYDLSLQVYGDSDHVLDIVKLIGLDSMNDKPIVGRKTFYQQANNYFCNYIIKNQINIVTGTVQGDPQDGGEYSNEDYNNDYNNNI